MITRTTSGWLRRLGWGALLGTLLLRALVPVGYMPATLASGWPVQLCPDGMSAEAMTALLGQSHQHHSAVIAQDSHDEHAAHSMAHHAAHHDGHNAAPTIESAVESVNVMPGKCDLAAFSGALAPPTVFANLSPLPDTPALFGPAATLHVRSTAFERYRSRAPPV